MNILHREFGWKYDIPTSNTAFSPQADFKLEYDINHADNNYIELPRSILRIRGVLAFSGVIVLCTITAVAVLAITLGLTFSTYNIKPAAITACSIIFMLYITIPYIRMDISHPRDTPIRFNRHRRKVYFYEYKFDRLHPLGRENWGIKPVVYDWDDLTAEVYSIHAPMGYGGIIEKVMVSIRKPGTDEVLDRLFFADDIEKGKQYWAIVTLFMQEGLEALPEFSYPPTDWSKEPSNPFERRAPKVQWPAEMDLESRTAPSHEEQLP